MKKTHLLAAALLLVFVLAACAPQPNPAPQAPAPAPTAVPSRPAVAAPVSTGKPAWQEKWDSVLAAAKAEGKVTIWTSGGFDIRNSLTKGMKGANGISAEVLSGRGDEFLNKLFAERRAGLYNYDIFFGGFSTVLPKAKSENALQSIDSALILPDVTDPDRIKKVWYKGELPFGDRDHLAFVTTLSARTPIVINTNLVKPDEIKSWRDILDSKWKGKLILGDPSVSGSGQMGLACIDGIMGWDFVKELAKAEPLVIRDQRQQIEWLAHGKVSVVVCPQPDAVIQFLRIGAPIKGIVPAEGTWISSGSTAIDYMNKEPHPNAAKVFISWITSKEGQDLFAPAIGFQSAREDVRTDYLRPEDVRQGGVKYFNGYSEEFNVGARRQEVNKLAKDLFGPMSK